LKRCMHERTNVYNTSEFVNEAWYIDVNGLDTYGIGI